MANQDQAGHPTLPALHLLTHRSETGVTRAAVAPAWGAAVVALTVQQTDWSWPVPVLEAVDPATLAVKPTSYGIPLLAPTPGRTGRDQSGRCTYGGEEYRLVPPRHGFLRDLEWQVDRRSAEAIVCAVEVRPDGPGPGRHGFPFQFRAEHEVRLTEGELRSTVRLTNTGDRVQPLNVGWHPYLHRAGECTVRVPAAGRWQLDGRPEPIPTGRVVAVTGADDFRAGRPLRPDERWDDVFTDLGPDHGIVECWIEERTALATRSGMAGFRLRRFVRFAADGDGERRPVRHVQLYTPPGRPALAIEPLSAPPDGLNLLAAGNPRADVCELEPGASAAFEIAVGLEAAAAGEGS